MEKLYTIKAGKKAKEIISDKGLCADDIEIIAGASGGPKWLVLAGIDDHLPGFIEKRKSSAPVHLIGSSIGSWRLAAYASKESQKALKNFEINYKAQVYKGRPTAKEVSDESKKILSNYLSEEDKNHIINHPFMKLHIITALSRGIGAFDNSLFLGPHLGITYLLNLLSRPLSNKCFKGIHFTTSKNEAPFETNLLVEKGSIELSVENIQDAILASGSIPLVMEGIKNIDGAPQGMYRDGGLIHYHLDLSFKTADEKIVLYPHFYDYIVPGWFDKSIPKPRYHQHPKDNVVLISPSEKFINTLQLKRIPDRTDFKYFYKRDDERFAWWDSVTDLSREMAKELFDDVSRGINKDSIELLT